MFFRDIIGQEDIKQLLVSMASHERVPHAQLFIGQEGAGALPMALAYAQYLQCESPVEGDSCGVCKACQKVGKHIHPDVHYSYPTVGAKALSTSLLPEWRKAISENPYLDLNTWLNYLNAEGKQGNITADECLDIIKRLSFKVFEGRYKVLILWLPEFLGKEGNRLLKLIEEPPDDTIFLLVAERQDDILSTIISRCQIIKFPPLTDDIITQALVSKHAAKPALAAQIAYLSDGSYFKALELLNHTDDSMSGLFLEWMRVCWQGKGTDIVAWLDKVTRLGRKDQKHFLQYGFHFLRETLQVQILPDYKPRLLNDELKASLGFAKSVPFRRLDALVTLLNDCSFYIDRNANAKVMFLNASIKAHHLMRRK